MKRRDLIAASLTGAGLVGYSALTLSQVINLNDAINKGGRQRMLSQRMAKSYLALGLGIMPSDADKTLESSMALFDRQLVELKAFAPSPEIKSTYQQLEAKWSDYKTALVGEKPSIKGAPIVLDLGNQVLSLANQGTGQLEKTANKPTGRLVNLSGRQRMLCQRIAAFYFGASWNIQPQNSRATMERARDEFLQAHEILVSAPENTARIAQELQLAQQQFVFFQAALKTVETGRAEKIQLAEVFQTSERILQVMDGITNLYSRIV